MATSSYRVTGMTCEGCVRAVTNAIKGIAPTADVKVDLKSNLVTVSDSVAASLVAQAIEGAGFGFAGKA